MIGCFLLGTSLEGFAASAAVEADAVLGSGGSGGVTAGGEIGTGGALRVSRRDLVFAFSNASTASRPLSMT